MMLLVGILVLVFALFSSASAQTLPTLADITLTSIPINPNPGQTVSLTAQSFGLDLTQTTLTWTYGGKTFATGTGRTTVSVVAPAAGNTATVTVTASGVGFDPVSASLLLNPASMDMLWEAVNAYTPPFYKGKAMLPIGGTFQVTAIPTANAPRQVSYSWSRNGSALPAASGLNQSTILLDNTIFNKQETIAATAYGGSYQGQGTVTISTGMPDVIAYQKKGGFIDYAHGSEQSITIDGGSATLRFEPYFFSSIGSVFNTTIFSLAVDDLPVSGDITPNEISLSQPSAGGTHRLRIDVSTVEYSLQHINKLFSLVFR